LLAVLDNADCRILFKLVSLDMKVNLYVTMVLKLTSLFHEELTNDMEQNSASDTNKHSASYETLRILWKSKVHYRVHNSSLIVQILSLMNPVHSLPFHPF
jgi:hypothetical protein